VRYGKFKIIQIKGQVLLKRGDNYTNAKIGWSHLKSSKEPLDEKSSDLHELYLHVFMLNKKKTSSEPVDQFQSNLVRNILAVKELFK
jgi:hypothetical protein